MNFERPILRWIRHRVRVRNFGPTARRNAPQAVQMWVNHVNSAYFSAHSATHARTKYARH